MPALLLHERDVLAARCRVLYVRYPLASAPWMAAMIETVQWAVAGVDLEDQTFTMIETFTHLPPHIQPNDGTDFSWHLHVDGRSVRVAPGACAAADLRFILTYDVGARLARMVYGDDPAIHAERDGIQAAALKSGEARVIGRLASMPEQLATRLPAVHDVMAIRTL